MTFSSWEKKKRKKNPALPIFVLPSQKFIYFHEVGNVISSVPQNLKSTWICYQNVVIKVVNTSTRYSCTQSTFDFSATGYVMLKSSIQTFHLHYIQFSYTHYFIVNVQWKLSYASTQRSSFCALETESVQSVSDFEKWRKGKLKSRLEYPSSGELD